MTGVQTCALPILVFQFNIELIKSHSYPCLKRLLQQKKFNLIKKIINLGLNPSIKLEKNSLLIYCIKECSFESLKFLIHELQILDTIHNQDITSFIISKLLGNNEFLSYLQLIYPKTDFNLLYTIFFDIDLNKEFSFEERKNLIKKVKYLGQRFIPKELKLLYSSIIKEKDTMFTLVLKAFNDNNINFLKDLFEFGASPNFQYNSELTFLHKAVLLNNIELVKIFLNYGSNPNILSKNPKLNLLFDAIKLNNLELIQLLIENGCNYFQLFDKGVNFIYLFINNNNSILHDVVRLKKNEILKYLISLGLNPNFLNFEKKTLLHIAIEYENFEACKFLLKKGASKNIEDIV